jgi:hypothetical protein
MKKIFLPCLVVAMSLLSLPVLAQDKADTTAKLGLAGDGLDLYATLDLFQNSKTIEAFEKSLNDPSTKINNLDLDLDKKVDFIKVVTEKKEKKDDDSHMFILRVDVSKKEAQDVAVILLDRDKDKKVSLQIVGDEELYGKDYVIEPKGNSSVTPNPGYKGPDPVTVTVEAPATNVVVQQAPVVQYVYSPAYVPYYPPYYYGYYPGWFAFSAVVTFGMYAGWNNHYHGGYYGGHYGGGNTVIINNGNKINHYNNNSRNRATQVSDNRARGNYGNGSLDHGRGGGISSRPSASTRPSTGAGGGSRPSASTRPSGSGGLGTSGSTRPSTSDRSGSGLSSSNRPSTSNKSSSSFNSPSTRSSSSYGGGGRSMGGGGGYRGGGGGGRRR